MWSKAQIKMAEAAQKYLIPAIEFLKSKFQEMRPKLQEFSSYFNDKVKPILAKVAEIIQTKVVPVFIWLIKKIQEFATHKDVMKALAIIIGVVVVAAVAALVIGLGFLLVTWAAIAGAVRLAVEVFQIWWKLWTTGINEIIALFTMLWNGITSGASATWAAITAGVNQVGALFAGLWAMITGAAAATWAAITGGWNATVALFTGLSATLVAVAVGTWTTISSTVTSVIDAIKNKWNEIVGAVSATFAAVSGIVSSTMDAVYNNTVGKINAIIDRINDVKNKLGSIAVGGATSKVSSFFGRATGGIVSGGLTLVGERGPELRSLAPGERIHSNPNTRSLLKQGGSRGGAGFTVNVYGSILAENDIKRIIRDSVQTGGYSGLLT
jgi:hypothetical protein